MNKTDVEWVVNSDGTKGFSWNPVVGCTHWQQRYDMEKGVVKFVYPRICAVGEKCWARKQAKRQRQRCEKCYAFTPHLHEERLSEPSRRKKPSTIVVCLMGDLFCKDVPNEWINKVISVAASLPRHRFLFLTKNPRRYQMFDFPENCWLGTTVNSKQDEHRIEELAKKKTTNHTFISFEPLYGPVDIVRFSYVPEWMIIGAQTKPNLQPEAWWVQMLMNMALGRAKLFLKNNLRYGPGIQHIPWRKE